MEVNSLRRAATVLLNARLIPLTDELIKAVKAGLREMGVKSPLMIVRGDPRRRSLPENTRWRPCFPDRPPVLWEV